VTAVAAYRRNAAAGTNQDSLTLIGRELTLVELKLDERVLSGADFEATPESLTIHRVPEAFALTTVTDIFLAKIRRSKGFMRRARCCARSAKRKDSGASPGIPTPGRDGALFVTLEADREKYPVLLSNGNCIKREDAGNGATA